jgi:hypothetical protein
MENGVPKQNHAFWREHVKKAESFSGTQNDYCRQNSISKSKFSYYKLKFAEVSKFAKVKLPSKPADIAVVTKSLVPAKAQNDPRWLAEFLCELFK